MENWGLITYRETSLLFDPKTSSASDKLWVTRVIAHELAHQVLGTRDILLVSVQRALYSTPPIFLKQHKIVSFTSRRDLRDYQTQYNMLSSRGLKL